jgi:hypothetical protein
MARISSNGLTSIGHISSQRVQETQDHGVGSSSSSSSKPKITILARFLTKSGGLPCEAGQPVMQVPQLKQ